jgi:hypothetical protein
MFESLQLLKGGYQNGHIAAIDQAQSHHDFGNLWDDTHDLDMTDEDVWV